MLLRRQGSVRATQREQASPSPTPPLRNKIPPFHRSTHCHVPPLPIALHFIGAFSIPNADQTQNSFRSDGMHSCVRVCGVAGGGRQDQGACKDRAMGGDAACMQGADSAQEGGSVRNDRPATDRGCRSGAGKTALNLYGVSGGPDKPRRKEGNSALSNRRLLATPTGCAIVTTYLVPSRPAPLLPTPSLAVASPPSQWQREVHLPTQPIHPLQSLSSLPVAEGSVPLVECPAPLP